MTATAEAIAALVNDVFTGPQPWPCTAAEVEEIQAKSAAGTIRDRHWERRWTSTLNPAAKAVEPVESKGQVTRAEVAWLRTFGWSDWDIARQLGLSVRTVETYRRDMEMAAA